MNRETIINKTIQIINKLPQEKAEAISDFADFLFKKYEERMLTEQIQNLVSESDAFSFLNNDEDDLYSVNDLKEKF